MNMSERDKRILMIVAPVALLVGFWFLLLAPKRNESAQAGSDLAKQEKRRDQAKAAVASAEASKNSFASDYTTLVRLGKAIPSRLDMPTVIVQLEAAAKGTGIEFTKIDAGDSAGGTTTTGSSPQGPAPPGQGNGSQPAAAGGAQAQSTPGKQAENAGNSVNNANSSSTKAGGDNQTNTQTSTPAGQSTTGTAASSTPAGLESVPVNLEFHGSFFRLADFFHRLKRFVRVANNRISVRGRLLTVDSMKFSSDPQIFPRLKAELTATVYLAPASEGATAGATPQGPAAPPTTTPTSGGSSASVAPTATATP